MSCLASNLITWFAPRNNMTAPSSHGITRPLNSMIGVPTLIGRAANNPTPLIGDLRFCHSRFRRCGFILIVFLTVYLFDRFFIAVCARCNATALRPTLLNWSALERRRAGRGTRPRARCCDQESNTCQQAGAGAYRKFKLHLCQRALLSSTSKYQRHIDKT